MQVLPSLVQAVLQSPSHALRYQLWLPLPQAGGEGGGQDGALQTGADVEVVPEWLVGLK